MQKRFADDKFKLGENVVKFSKRVEKFKLGENGGKFSKREENTVGKGEIARDEYFLQVH